jgi:hypothetical protein
MNKSRQASGKESKSQALYLAAGIPRSGSTWLFNALRLLLQIRYTNVYSSWIGDFVKPRSYSADAILLKLHSPDQEWAARTQNIFTSHRDLRDIAISSRDMGWVHDAQAMFATARSARAHHEYWARHALLDISYYDIVASPTDVLIALADVCEIEVSRMAVESLNTQLSSLACKEARSRSYDVENLMYPGHRFDGKPGRFQNALPREIAEEIWVQNRGWMEKMGYEHVDRTLQGK